MTHVSISNINVLLPSIQQGIDASNSQLQWVLAGYTLTFGMVLIPAGRAGDFFGQRGVFMIGVTIFITASAWAVMAPTASSLVLARLLQGVGSGLINPQSMGVIQQNFSGPERARAFGAFGATVGIAAAIGPLIGGLIVEIFGIENGWRATIALNIPIGILSLVLAVIWIPKQTKSIKRKFGATLKELDMIGALLIGFGVLAVMIPFMEAGNNPIFWFALPLGLAVIYFWIYWEKRHERVGTTPMVKLSTFRITSFRNGVLIGSFYFLGFTSIWVLVALYMQDALGHTAFESGLVGLPSAIMAAVFSTVAGRMVSIYGRKVVIFGIYLAFIGFITTGAVVMLSYFGHVSEWWLLLTLSFIGAAQGAVISPNQSLTLAEVPPSESGSLGGVMQTGQRLGNSIGLSLVTAVTFYVLTFASWGVAITAGILLMTLILIYVLFVAYSDLKPPRAGKIGS